MWSADRDDRRQSLDRSRITDGESVYEVQGATDCGWTSRYMGSE